MRPMAYRPVIRWRRRIIGVALGLVFGVAVLAYALDWGLRLWLLP